MAKKAEPDKQPPDLEAVKAKLEELLMRTRDKLVARETDAATPDVPGLDLDSIAAILEGKLPPLKLDSVPVTDPRIVALGARVDNLVDILEAAGIVLDIVLANLPAGSLVKLLKA